MQQNNLKWVDFYETGDGSYEPDEYPVSIRIDQIIGVEAEDSNYEDVEENQYTCRLKLAGEAEDISVYGRFQEIMQRIRDVANDRSEGQCN